MLMEQEPGRGEAGGQPSRSVERAGDRDLDRTVVRVKLAGGQS
jgi:hypothetical protein